MLAAPPAHSQAHPRHARAKSAPGTPGTGTVASKASASPPAPTDLTAHFHALAKAAAHHPDCPALARAITCMQNGNGSRFLAHVRQKKIHHQLADLSQHHLAHIGLLAAFNNCPDALSWFLKHTRCDPADSLLFFVLANPDRSHFLRLALESPKLNLHDDRVTHAFTRALYARREAAIHVFMDFPTPKLIHLAFRSALFLESIGDEPLIDIPEVCAKLLEYTCMQCPEPIPVPPCATLPLFPQLPPPPLSLSSSSSRRSASAARARLTCMPKPVLKRIVHYLDAHAAYALRFTCTRMYKRVPVDHLVPDRFLLLAYTIFHRDFAAASESGDSEDDDGDGEYEPDSDDDDDDDEIWESIHDSLHLLAVHPRVMRSTHLRTLALILAIREGLWSLASDILSGVTSTCTNALTLSANADARSRSRSRRPPVLARLDPAVYIWAICTQLGLLSSPDDTAAACGNHECCAHVCDASCPVYHASQSTFTAARRTGGTGTAGSTSSTDSECTNNQTHTPHHHHVHRGSPVTPPALHTLSLLVRHLGTRAWLFLHHPDFARLLALLPPDPSVDSDRALVFSVLVPLVRGQSDLVVQRLKSLPPEMLATMDVDEGAVRNILCAAIRLGSVAPVRCLIDTLKVRPWDVDVYGHAHLCRLAAASGSRDMHDLVARWLGTDGKVPPYAGSGVKSATAQRLRAKSAAAAAVTCSATAYVDEYEAGTVPPPPHRECIIAAKLNGHDDLALHILKQCEYPVDDPRIAAFFCPCCVAESLDPEGVKTVKEGLKAMAGLAVAAAASSGCKSAAAAKQTAQLHGQNQAQQQQGKPRGAGKGKASGAAMS
ncbi:hypothetical protein BCR44DRAFT_34548 [Catenaria anguillulae PL171]|uniref:Uncharacterized protein n=1 Tax=Catenaria anguillulae PL171 TaxID=765915 RepID=A0A1Y2I304_9FUNG|nr:hypothetical protein BCR44DRAFT_34548 [Catenaria anguillulae PL171]